MDEEGVGLPGHGVKGGERHHVEIAPFCLVRPQLMVLHAKASKAGGRGNETQMTQQLQQDVFGGIPYKLNNKSTTHS